MATQILPTMGAVIFGNPNQNALGDTIGQIEANRQRQAQERVRQSQQLANSWRQNQLKAYGGQLWNNEISQLQQRHLSQGQDLVRQGIDPYSSTDPRALQYQQERLNLENMTGYAKALEKEYNSVNDLLASDATKWNPSDIAKLNEFISGSKIEDLYEQNARLPQVRQNFNVQEAIKGSAVPFDRRSIQDGIETTEKGVDAEATRNTILSRLSLDRTGQGAEFIGQITSGYGPAVLNNLPETNEAVTTLIDGMYDYSPQLRETLALQGITSKDDPRYTQFLEVEAQNMLNAKQRYNTEMDNLVQSVSGGQTIMSGRRPNNAEQAERDRQEGVRQRNIRFNERHWSRGSSDDSYADGEFEDGTISWSSPSTGGGDTRFNFTTPTVNNRRVSIPSTLYSGKYIDLSSGLNKEDRGTVKGDVVGFVDVPVHRTTGNMVGDEYLRNNPDKVKWEKKARLYRGEGKKDFLIPANSVKENLTKAQKKVKDEFMKQQSPSYRAPSAQSSGTTNTKTKISW